MKDYRLDPANRAERVRCSRPAIGRSVAALLSAAGALASCGTSDFERTSGVSDPPSAAATPPADVIEGTLIHSEQLGATVTVEFWRTGSGLVSIVTGSLDEDLELSDQINAALDRPSVVDAYRALPGIAEDAGVPRSLLDLQAEIERTPVERYFDDEHRKAFESAVSSEAAKRINGAEARLDRLPRRVSKPGALGTLATPPNWNWQTDYQTFRNNYCSGGEQDCLTGYQWVYGGQKSNLTFHKMHFFNNSFEGNAAYGSRSARWVNGAWSWRSDVNRSIASRGYVSLTYYGGLGPMLRDGWISGNSVSNLTGSTPNFTSTPLSADPRVSYAQLWTPFTLKGLVSTAFASTTQNRCAYDVGLAYNYLSPGPTSKIYYRSMGGQTLPPFNTSVPEYFAVSDVKHHIQGIGRLAGVGDNRWLVVSRSNSTRGAVFLAHMSDLPGTGYPFGAPASSNPPTTRAARYYYPIDGVPHPSALQTFGKYAAVAVEAPTAPSFIQFYDFGSPGSANAAIHRFYTDNTRSENPPVDRVLSAVGVTRLSDNRYLMAVIGQDSTRRAWFYVTHGTAISSNTTWSYLGTVAVPSSQNAQLITECGTGDIYILLTHNERYSFGNNNRYGNYAYLRKITYTDFTISSTKVTDDLPFDSGDGDFCTFRAGVSTFIDQQGRLSLICHTRHVPAGDSAQRLKIAEFTRYLP